ncbi:MAG: ATP-binding cassette domain-containing protein [Gemmatimonadota bacterium]
MRFEGVSLRLGERRVLTRLTLDLRGGETLVLLGRSGAGKSTALRLVNRLLDPTEGVVRVEGRPTTEWDPIALRRRIGYVIQEGGLFPHLTVGENVGLVPRLLGWAADEIRTRVAEVLRLVGLPAEEFGSRHPSELSGGQQQRVGVARALAADPPILLCDEPFGALDPITRSDLQREFRALGRGLAQSLIFVTHDVREALLLADRIAFLEEGHLRFLGTPPEFRMAEAPAVRAFVEAVAPRDTRDAAR